MRKLVPAIIMLLGLSGCSSFYLERNPNYTASSEKDFKEAITSLQGKGVYRDNKGKLIDIPYDQTVFAVPDNVLGKNWEYKEMTDKEYENVMKAEKVNLDNYFLNVSTK